MRSAASVLGSRQGAPWELEYVTFCCLGSKGGESSELAESLVSTEPAP